MIDTKKFAKQIRLDCVRMTSVGGSSHIGSILSIADILAVLYGKILRVDPSNLKWEDRDRFVLSKGHAGAGVYSALSQRGFFDREKLLTHYQDGSDLSGHVSHKGIPGVEFSTGSLGHGLPVAAGMAFAARLDNKKHRVFVVMSDGECDEGSNWEAFLFSPHHNLSNLVAIIDYNNLQSMSTVEETLNLEPFEDKLVAFGWRVCVVDGHNHDKLCESMNIDPQQQDKPTCIIAKTTKGKGVSFMENNVLWHYRSPQGEEYDLAIKELEESQ